MPAPRVAIMGAGVVGTRAARELVSADSPMPLALHTSRGARRDELTRVFADPIRSGTFSVHGAEEPLAPSVELVVLTGDQDDQVRAAEAHLREGRSVVTTVDSHIHAAALTDLDGLARSKDATVVIGACFSPGLTDVLAVWGAARMDSVSEVHFARHGSGGPRCSRDRLAALAGSAHVWRGASWHTRRAGTGRALCWFPDPVGGRDAVFADTAEPLLAVTRWGDLQRCSARTVLSVRDRLTRWLPTQTGRVPTDSPGAVRVELRGVVDTQRCTLVLGAFDRPGVVCGVVISEVVGSILGGEGPRGSLGVGSVADATSMLRRLRARGIRVGQLDEPDAGGPRVRP